jgi:hypothetical protein
MEATSEKTVPSLILPPALAAEVEAAAAEEHRPVLDVLQDVITRGLEERRWQRVLAYGAEHAKSLGFTEEDVPRLIAEYRTEQRQGRE